jgi:peptide/nickel transport system permease protein
MTSKEQIIGRRLSRGDGLLKQLWQDPLGRAGFLGIALIILLAVFAPLIARYDVAQINARSRLAAPSITYWFGTDNFGRDIFSRIIYGARVSLIVGLVSVGIAAGIGYLFGLAAGYFEGRVESAIMMLMDIIFAFPSILLALLIVAVLGTSVVNTMIAIGIVNIPVFARTVRASVKAVKGTDYIANARSVGLKNGAILLRHITPNALAPFTVQATLALSGAICRKPAHTWKSRPGWWSSPRCSLS